MKSVLSSTPTVPFAGFPLRKHRNGQWYKSVWNARVKRSEHFYFGARREDPSGDRALNDPTIGWLARRSAIKAGIDNVRVVPASDALSLGELMSRFLAHKLAKCRSGELSRVTLGDYLREIENFVAFMKPDTPPAGLTPDHFAAYMAHLTTERKLGRHSRRRVRAYVMAMMHFGASNGWFTLPATGSAWKAPATDADSVRQAKAREGIVDHSNRVLCGAEINRLLARSNPTFRAMILLGVNCGLGPADIGRLR